MRYELTTVMLCLFALLLGAGCRGANLGTMSGERLAEVVQDCRQAELEVDGRRVAAQNLQIREVAPYLADEWKYVCAPPIRLLIIRHHLTYHLRDRDRDRDHDDGSEYLIPIFAVFSVLVVAGYYIWILLGGYWF